MSAPSADRNSPPPSEQSHLQTGATGTGNVSESKGEESSRTEEQSKDEESKLGGLESNPVGPVEGEAQEKVGKD